ncbi:MAG: alanyl aminopeptidase, partial [Paraglaciecola sp.]
AALLVDIKLLNVREKKSLLYNSEALLKAGEIQLSQHMTVLDALAGDDNPVVARAVVAALADFVYLVDDSNKVAFGQFIERKLLPWFTRLGVEENPNDANDVSRLRSAVFGMLGRYSQNKEVQNVSLKLTEQYLQDPASVPRSIAVSAMRSMAKYGSADWFEKFKTAYQTTSDATIQGTIGTSMIFPQSENVQKLLNFSLSEHVSPANTIGILAVASRSQDKLDVFYTWMEQNIDPVTAKMPAFHIARMPEYLSSSCNTHNIWLAGAFYNSRMVKYEGMQRSYDIAMDKSRQCLALKKLNQQTFNDYLNTVLSH